MGRLLFARRPAALASATLAVALVSLCGSGSALGADRMVLAEGFVSTG